MTKPYTVNELLIISIAREINDGENIILGIGIPMIGGAMAKARHAPQSTLMMESGIIDFKPTLPLKHVADCTAFRGFSCAVDLFTTFTMTYRGFVDLCVLGVGQVDRYGNVNTTVIGPYENPVKRLPGAGGASDFISYSKKTILTMRAGEFVETLSYRTSPGYLVGRESRNETGHFPKDTGPVMLINTDGIFEFDPETREMFLAKVHPGMQVAEIKAKVPWDLKIAKDLSETRPPTEDEIDFVRQFAPSEAIGKDLMYELALTNLAKQKSFQDWGNNSLDDGDTVRQASKP